MEILFFIFYLVLCSSALLVIPFYKNSGLGKWLVGIFFIKISAGLTYAWFYKLPKNYADADTWRFYRLSLADKNLLLNSPTAFLKDIFSHGYSRSGNLFSGENTYWNDLKSNIVVKILAVMNVVTNNSYYADLVLFNFVFLFGLVGLFKVFNAIDPAKKHVLIFCVFLLPSTLFWCSGIHKDGLILSALGTILYSFHVSLNYEFSQKRIALILFSFIFIFFLRNYIALALLPSLLCWWLSNKWPERKKMIFVSIYSTGIFLFFVVSKMTSIVDLPGFVVSKQEEFLKLSGHSMVIVPPLQPTFTSFLMFFPYAMDMAFFRPHLYESNNLSYLPAALEIIILNLSVIFLAVFGRKKPMRNPMLFSSIAFGLTVLLLAGYTIPFYGAIVRYRALVLPLIFSAIFCLFTVKKDNQYIK